MNRELVQSMRQLLAEAANLDVEYSPDRPGGSVSVGNASLPRSKEILDALLASGDPAVQGGTVAKRLGTYTLSVRTGRATELVKAIRRYAKANGMELGQGIGEALKEEEPLSRPDRLIALAMVRGKRQFPRVVRAASEAAAMRDILQGFPGSPAGAADAYEALGQAITALDHAIVAMRQMGIQKA